MQEVRDTKIEMQLVTGLYLADNPHQIASEVREDWISEPFLRWVFSRLRAALAEPEGNSANQKILLDLRRHRAGATQCGVKDAMIAMIEMIDSPEAGNPNDLALYADKLKMIHSYRVRLVQCCRALDKVHAEWIKFRDEPEWR